MRITGDRPLASETLWSIRSVMALEPFVDISVDPGKDLSWKTHTPTTACLKATDFPRYR